MPRHTIGAAYGDAFLAAVGSGLAEPGSIAEWNPVEHTVEPDPAAGRAYEELYAVYRDVYPPPWTRPTLAARQHRDAAPRTAGTGHANTAE
ncbi:hypothetical protein NKH77_04535 [Streptomyces sp. M19]